MRDALLRLEVVTEEMREDDSAGLVVVVLLLRVEFRRGCGLGLEVEVEIVAFEAEEDAAEVSPRRDAEELGLVVAVEAEGARPTAEEWRREGFRVRSVEEVEGATDFLWPVVAFDGLEVAAMVEGSSSSTS